MQLTTKDLILRTLTEADIGEIARMWRHPETITLQEAQSVLEKMEYRHNLNRIKAIHHLCLGVFQKEAPTRLIGWCGLDGQISPGETVLFYIIAEEHSGKGYATQCARELLRYAFEDMEYDIIYSGCAKDNVASFRVMEKAGMRHHEVYEDGGLGFYMDKALFMQTQKQGMKKRSETMKKLILLSGSPCVGKTTIGQYLFEQFDNSAYLDGDWCWCVHPFSVKDKRLRNGDKNMSFILSNYLNSDFDYVFFTSVVLTDQKIRDNILKDIAADDYEVVSFTLTCSEETLVRRHDRRGDEGETNFYWLHLTPNPADIVIDTDNKTVEEIGQEMKRYIE